MRSYHLSVADSLAIGVQETNLLGFPGARIRPKTLSLFAESQAVKEPPSSTHIRIWYRDDNNLLFDDLFIRRGSHLTISFDSIKCYGSRVHVTYSFAWIYTKFRYKQFLVNFLARSKFNSRESI
jgi:hypothetical protein